MITKIKALGEKEKEKKKNMQMTFASTSFNFWRKVGFFFPFLTLKVQSCAGGTGVLLRKICKSV